ncbi:hypothetical protein Dda_2468 [Drechslerella dactyloides]|uniref:Uncharacterized protein n=1 Tax=Drechslerella dactyloides TaxID=74499 RepID=A0AAD6NKS6_DREDA|nr:hypothetical protein Dda_2468 [Drechslerella dactyloides]
MPSCKRAPANLPEEKNIREKKSVEGQVTELVTPGGIINETTSSQETGPLFWADARNASARLRDRLRTGVWGTEDGMMMKAADVLACCRKVDVAQNPSRASAGRRLSTPSFAALFITVMPGPTTIDEALESLPSSSDSFTATGIPREPSSGRRQLLVKGSKFASSKSAESYKPPKLEWHPLQTHILTGAGTGNGRLTRIGKVKESILIAGRDTGVKQSLKFKNSLPLPFLSQNGDHEEDLVVDLKDDPTPGQDAVGGGLTASDLELDPQSDGNGSEGAGMSADFLEDMDDDPKDPTPVKPIPASRPSKRRRTNSSNEDNSDSLPRDFLELLEAEVPGGRKKVSPGDFARVWKMSGRKMGNDMVLAQNKYFSTSEKDGSKPETKKNKARGKGRP